MYEPHRQQKEPSGCMQTIVISRLIIGILLIPLALIGGGIVAVLVAFVLAAEHPLYALLFVMAAAGTIILVARWESRRVSRERPPGDSDR